MEARRPAPPKLPQTHKSPAEAGEYAGNLKPTLGRRKELGPETRKPSTWLGR